MTLTSMDFSRIVAAQALLTDIDDSTYYPLTIMARAKLPSRYGEFEIVAFSPTPDGKEHIAVVRGNLAGEKSIPVRLHSECLTGDVMGSLRCDCRDQLEAALRYIAERDCGAVLYLRQEGRGIGLVNKIKAYTLQERGRDTVDANHELGFEDDERDYTIAAGMLKALGIESIQLLSNNPKKFAGLKQNGIQIDARVPHIMPANKHNHFYLETKAKRSGHLIDLNTV
ncbi:GTP cyclohydrolase II [bacterium]|nr:GTP cyclohydrolase II [bacterium]